MAKTKRSSTRVSGKKDSHRKGSDPRWSSKVTTVSTFPPKDLYTKDANTIARVMATKKVSPKGLGSAIRMVQFYINRPARTCPPRVSGNSKRPKNCCRKKPLEKLDGSR